jgi:hypothetical protein
MCVCVCVCVAALFVCPGEGVFWRRYEGIVKTNNSNLQNALIVGSIDPAKPVPSGGQSGLWAPQNEYWMAGPVTFVNYGQSGAIKLCADVRCACLIA